MLRGKGLVLDLGKRNMWCRFVVVKYFWSQADRERYDRFGDPPRRAWNIHKHTPVVRVTFLRLQHFDDLHPCGTKNSQYCANVLLKSRRSSLIVCDLFPYRCIRQTHSRFIFPSDRLPHRMPNTAHVTLLEGMLDQYHVDEDKLMDVITGPVSGETQIFMGLQRTPVHAGNYSCSLGAALEQGVDKFATADGETIELTDSQGSD